MKKLKNNPNFYGGSSVVFPSNYPIQSKVASDFLKKEQLTVAYLIKEGLLEETGCGDCFVVKSKQKE